MPESIRISNPPACYAHNKRPAGKNRQGVRKEIGIEGGWIAGPGYRAGEAGNGMAGSPNN